MAKVIIGVLALQGASEPHVAHLAAVAPDLEVRLVRRAVDLENLAGLILPGGESTTMLRLLEQQQLFEPLARACARVPVWGICAGAILLAKRVLPAQPSLAICDVTIARNAYGRQLDSFVADVWDHSVAFIRAPKIVEASPHLEVRARYLGDPVWVEQGRVWLTTFHAELSAPLPSPFHAQFAERCSALNPR